MNRRLTAIVALALMIAAAASFVVYRLIRNRTLAENSQASSRIVVASKDLEAGAVLRDADLSYASWSGPLPKGFKAVPKDLVGRGLMTAIYEGEPLTEFRLAPTGAGGGLASTIPAGMRACAVRVNDVVGVAGFVLPGMRVDVLVSGSPAGTQGGARAKTILQNVRVLSAGHNFQRDAEGKPVEVPVVNLLVTPEQAEVLSLASNETRIQLVLRNPLDKETAETRGSNVADLFGETKRPVPAPAPFVARKLPPLPQPVAPPPPPAPVLQTQRIEVLNGPKHSEASFITSPEANR